MKKIFTILCFALVLSTGTFAQNDDPRLAQAITTLSNDPTLGYGCNSVIRFDVPQYTKAPKGYEAFYIWQYSRHGSRYAWDSNTYSKISEILKHAEEEGNLTGFGTRLNDRVAAFAERCLPYYGELTRKGWNQQNKVAKQLYASELKLFRNDPYIESVSTFVPRAIMSEASFCLSLKEENPGLDIYEILAATQTRNAAPKTGISAERVAALPKYETPWNCSGKEFFDAHFDCDAALGRIFRKTKDSYDGWSPKTLVSELWTLVIGTLSLDFEADFSDVFTPEEMLSLTRIDCFQSYLYAIEDIYAYTPIYTDLIDDVENHLGDKRPQVRLRFGHDYVLCRILPLLGVGAFAEVPATPEATLYTFPLYEIPMACNLRLIFYRKKGAETLVKAVLNGRETTLPLPPSEGNCYKFTDLKAYVEALPRP